MQPNKRCFTSEDQFEQLFPRLPNEITFCRIVPKLPWRAFHILAAVSRVWRKAIQDHRIYDARVHSCSTDTLVVHAHSRYGGRFATISVYSVRDKLCYNLPPIPGHSRGIPSSCECVSLDGKIYVLGGAINSMEKRCSHDSSSKVYVMDLAGASHWKECASMERGRQKFGCGVIEGKIYVFGGTHYRRPVRGAEVYNPKANAWSPIMPMRALRYDHRACTFAGKIVVHGGAYYDEEYIDWRRTHEGPTSAENSAVTHIATVLEIYHPGEDEWTVDEVFSHVDDAYFVGPDMFMVEGKFHVMKEDAIYVTDDSAGDTSWRRLKANSFPPIGHVDCVQNHVTVSPMGTVVLNDELVAGVSWHNGDGLLNSGSCILQSKGFGTENSKIVWKVVSNCAGTFDFMHCIQL